MPMTFCMLCHEEASKKTEEDCGIAAFYTLFYHAGARAASIYAL